MIELSVDWKWLKENICAKFQMKNARIFEWIIAFVSYENLDEIEIL